MEIKNCIIACFFAFILGGTIVGGFSYYFFIEPSRSDLAAVRADAERYLSRAIDSEDKLRRSQEIIRSGSDKLDGAVGNIQQVIEKIRIVREILSELAKAFSDTN